MANLEENTNKKIRFLNTLSFIAYNLRTYCLLSFLVLVKSSLQIADTGARHWRTETAFAASVA